MTSKSLFHTGHSPIVFRFCRRKAVWIAIAFLLPAFLSMDFSGPGACVAKEKTTTRENAISLSLRQADIRDAFSSLAMEFKANIVLSAEVSGKVTLHIFDATLEEAVQDIAMAGGFTAEKQGKLFHVYKKNTTARDLSDGHRIKIFKLNFVEIGQIKELLNALPGISSIQVHEDTKTIVVDDTPENIRRVETVIRALDAMPKQVLIEAQILEVNLGDDMTLGVDWQAIWTDLNISTSGFSNAILPEAKGVSPVPDSGSGGFANLFTTTGSSSTIAMAIDALKQKTKVNTVSTPKITALNGRTARVQVGGQQGYTVTTTNLGVVSESIEFIDTGVILEITPYIDDHDNVLLNVKPAINTADIEEGVPVVNSTSVSTWLVARNGETLFIGGLIENAESKTRKYIPVLGEIPLIGHLFGRTVNSQNKVETVVLITPRILDPNEPFTPAPRISRSGKLLSEPEPGTSTDTTDKNPSTKDIKPFSVVPDSAFSFDPGL